MHQSTIIQPAISARQPHQISSYIVVGNPLGAPGREAWRGEGEAGWSTGIKQCRPIDEKSRAIRLTGLPCASHTHCDTYDHATRVQRQSATRRLGERQCDRPVSFRTRSFPYQSIHPTSTLIVGGGGVKVGEGVTRGKIVSSPRI